MKKFFILISAELIAVCVSTHVNSTCVELPPFMLILIIAITLHGVLLIPII